MTASPMRFAAWLFFAFRDDKMGYTPVTPFRRMMDAAVLERDQMSRTPLPSAGVNKWEALRELSVARSAYGLSDRDMAVLQGVLSFHPETTLGGNAPNLIVHASNDAICERLNGMPCSTMRRHLARLVAAGVLVRRDSPNGKRYARKTHEGKEAFGFDLSPLVHLFPEFCRLAEGFRAGEARLARLRETVSLMRRDLAGLATYGEEVRPDLRIWTRLQDLAALTARALKRRLAIDDLLSIRAQMEAGLDEARDVLEPRVSEKMSSNDAENEQHDKNSNTDSHVFELRAECAQATPVELVLDRTDSEMKDGPVTDVLPESPQTRLPLRLVVSACPEILSYAPEGIRHWHQLMRAAELVRPMMGISPDAWDEAKTALGPEDAAVVISALLQRFESIKSPGGYLRRLTQKATDGVFSTGPMVMALMRKAAA